MERSEDMTKNNNPECNLKDRKCEFVFDCNYLNHRFGVLADPCMDKKQREKIIEEKYQEELKERKRCSL